MKERDPYKLYPHDHVMRYTLIPLIPKFVTPNMITVLRMLCVPLVMWLLLTEQFGIGIPVFIFVALTDAIDGSLARLRKQITEWGTMYDPIADKLLIGLVVLIVVTKYINVVFGLMIIIVESLILLGAYFQRLDGKKVSANVFGKTKMLLQVIGVGFLLIALWAGYDLFIPLSIGTLSVAIVMAIISLFTYGA